MHFLSAFPSLHSEQEPPAKRPKVEEEEASFWPEDLLANFSDLLVQ